MNTNFLSNYQKLESFKEKLEKDYEEKLNGLLNDFIDQLEVSPLHKIFILDFLEKMYQHSETTYKHSIDVAFRTYELGSKFLNSNDEYYKLDKKQLNELCVAALLHDAGKLDINLSILHKDGKLTDEEFKVMQSHSIKAQSHIKNFSPNIINLAVHHHEKLDGTGYPDKLKGDEISLSNRILTVADVTSALYQKRSYKKEWSTENVVEELRGDVVRGKADAFVTENMVNLISAKQNSLDATKENENKNIND